ncbi:MAG: YbaN family protein [Oligoflexia bacterium]|nr:YbaN family protein [Oligoflexia bacterium]
MLFKNRLVRALLFIFGAIFVTLGVFGLFLPLLPATPFLLLAAWCFMQSLEKAYHWIHNHSVLGRAIKNWQENRAISRSSKYFAIACMFVSIVYTAIQVKAVLIKYSVIAFLVCVSIFIWTRNENILKD